MNLKKPVSQEKNGGGRDSLQQPAAVQRSIAIAQQAFFRDSLLALSPADAPTLTGAAQPVDGGGTAPAEGQGGRTHVGNPLALTAAAFHYIDIDSRSQKLGQDVRMSRHSGPLSSQEHACSTMPRTRRTGRSSLSLRAGKNRRQRTRAESRATTRLRRSGLRGWVADYTHVPASGIARRGSLTSRVFGNLADVGDLRYDVT